MNQTLNASKKNLKSVKAYRFKPWAPWTAYQRWDLTELCIFPSFVMLPLAWGLWKTFHRKKYGLFKSNRKYRQSCSQVSLLNFVSEDFTATKSYVDNKFKVKVNEDDRGYAFLNPHDFLYIYTDNWVRH